MRKVKLNLNLKGETMDIVILQVNGNTVEKSLNYLPEGRGFYTLTRKGEKNINLHSTEEVLKALKELQDKGTEKVYIKVPSGFKSVQLDDLRIA